MRTDLDKDLDFAGKMSARLDDSARAQLRRYDFDPSESNWDDVYCIVISPNLTVWQAWVATDNTAPRKGNSTNIKGEQVEPWPKWPTQQEFRRAIFYATH